MKKNLKMQLTTAFDAPPPMKKTEFLQSVNYPKTSRTDFIFGQVGYIRKRVWVTSCLLLVTAFIGLRSTSDDGVLSFIWFTSSLLPFLSLVTVSEIARSASHNMEELEMSCKYNFPNVILARLGILSFMNLSLFGVILLSFHNRVDFGTLRTGTYLLVPFMLTCSLSLFTLNRLHSRETTYVCGAISCLTSIANTLAAARYRVAFSDENAMFWGLAFLVLLVVTISETIKLIKETEELQWNL